MDGTNLRAARLQYVRRQDVVHGAALCGCEAKCLATRNKRNPMKGYLRSKRTLPQDHFSVAMRRLKCIAYMLEVRPPLERGHVVRKGMLHRHKEDTTPTCMNGLAWRLDGAGSKAVWGLNVREYQKMFMANDQGANHFELATMLLMAPINPLVR